MANIKTVALVCFNSIFLASIATADVAVIGGDTIDKDGVIIRIHGIDAPEYAQKCGSIPCGKLAVDAMAKLVEGQTVSCEVLSTDNYGRSIAKCYVGETDIGSNLVETGNAWAFTRFSNDYVKQQAIAKSANIGIWSANSKPAWEYREERWSKAEQEAPEGCPIKGNISKNGKIYHAPWSPWYTRTKINTSKGERWFCSEGEATSAGWRAPYWR